MYLLLITSNQCPSRNPLQNNKIALARVAPEHMRLVQELWPVVAVGVRRPGDRRRARVPVRLHRRQSARWRLRLALDPRPQHAQAHLPLVQRRRAHVVLEQHARTGERHRRRPRRAERRPPQVPLEECPARGPRG